jgi:hypothetical protein
MKNKQAEPKYATYGQLVDELAKFDQKDPACVIASTDLGSPDEGENFIDGSGVISVRVVRGVVKITCGDSGMMTWEQVRAALRDRITLNMVDQPAIVQIGYPGMVDFEDRECELRWVKECGVIEGDDTIWNVELGPAL